MKFILGILVVGILTLIFGWWLPWWSIALAGLIGGLLLSDKSWQAFLIGCLGTGITWAILCIFINQANNGLLLGKIGVLFNGLSPALLIIITAIIGGIVSGFGALTGFYTKGIVKPVSS